MHDELLRFVFVLILFLTEEYPVLALYFFVVKDKGKFLFVACSHQRLDGLQHPDLQHFIRKVFTVAGDLRPFLYHVDFVVELLLQQIEGRREANVTVQRV